MENKRLERLKDAIDLLKSLGIIEDQGDVAADLGYRRANTISDILNNRATLTPKFVKAFCNKYGIQEDWILYGLGKLSIAKDFLPKKGKNKEVIPLGKHVPLRLSADEYGKAFGDWPGLPMYNNPITASFIETYRDDTQYQPQYYLHDPRFRDCDFGAIITGDSMHAEIRHGDFVACKEVTDKRFIVFGDIYYVVANNGLETCKYLNVDPNDKNNFLLIAKSERISPSPIPKDMILKLYKVRGIVRGY